MNKFYLFAFPVFVFFSFSASSQPVDYRNLISRDSLYSKSNLIIRNATKDTIEIARLKRGIKHGKQVLFFNNGEVERISNYKNGRINGKVVFYAQGRKDPVRIEHYKAFPKEMTSRLHGISKRYNADGNLSEMIHYVNGAKNGKYEIYHSNGNLREKGVFENNLNKGRKLYYKEDGVLLRDEHYIIIDNPDYKQGEKQVQEKKTKVLPHKEIVVIPPKISVLDGKSKYYHSNGKLSAEFIFKKGLKEGLCKEYHPDKNNTLKSEVVFKNGLEHGSFAYYRSNGNLEKKGIFYREIAVGDTVLKNVYDGTIEIYQENGNRGRTERWKNFKKNGYQEAFHYNSGGLYERSFMIDNLLSGIFERFNTDGNKNYEAYYEIVIKDGSSVSQQTGTETHWENGRIKSITHWENGMKNGVSTSYFANGQPEKIMHFKEGKLHGPYQTFYENGQIKVDYNKYQPYSSSLEVGWNATYDADGSIERKFYADEKGKNIVSHLFENGGRKELNAEVLGLSFSENHLLNSIQWPTLAGSAVGFDMFGNQQLRSVKFQMKDFPALSANFASNGELIQIIDSRGNYIEDGKIIEMAEKIALQYNPDWKDEPLASSAFPNGKYQWHYADGKPFFEVEFEDDLLQGKWMLHNPVLNDTLFYGEFNHGFPVGKLVRKKMDGTPEVRRKYFPNHTVKENYRYEHNGNLAEFSTSDSLGNRIFSEEYYTDGSLRMRKQHDLGNYIHFLMNGDTLSYQLLGAGEDSIIVRRQFFEGNKIKSDRHNNYTTGDGYSKTYFENGQIQTSHDLKDDKTHGIYQKFDAHGNLLALGHFKNGERHGIWITYDQDGREEVSFFQNGEIQIDYFNSSADENNPCACHDTSMAGSKIGFANSLAYFAPYESIKPYIPASITPVNDWNYDKIFFINLITNGDNRGGSTRFKLLFFNDFSFYYPQKEYLKFNLIPCKTEGYMGTIDANVSYNFETKELVFGGLETNRIAISLERNPLEAVGGDKLFTAFFDVDYLEFNADGLTSVRFPKEKNECFPPGIINDFINIQVEHAQLEINPKLRFSVSGVPLLANEVKRFYGLEISKANIRFEIDSVEVEAKCEKILAGANFVAARIFVEGKPKDEDQFTLSDSSKVVSLSRIQHVLERNGFYRVKTEVIENKLFIEFYAEK